MKLPRAHQLIPAIVFTAAAAIPLGTGYEMLTHVASASSPSGFTSVAALAPSPTATPPNRRTTKKAKATSARSAKSAATQAIPLVYAGPWIYGNHTAVQATISVSGRKIVNVAISTQPSEARSASIDAQAVPLLRSSTLQAQSANVNTVSGATETSDAYAQSLQAALQKAHLA